MIYNGLPMKSLSMDIDLEQPSGQEGKLDTKLDTDGTKSTDLMHPVGSVINSSQANTQVLETLVQNEGKSISRTEDVRGMDAVNVYSNEEVRRFEPQKGLEFETKEAAYSFYREYARSVGFGITIKASRRSKKSGKFIDVKIACSRFGNKRESSTTVNPRSCPKTGCKASMHMKRRQDGKWFIYGFVNEHNHEICPDDFYYAIRGRNKQDSIVCQKKGLQLALDVVDVQMLLDYFMFMQDENPNFFYAVDLDHVKPMRNVLWIDAKGRHDYNYFCDVVFFDTSYVKDKYRVPFIPVFGVNHHFQLILFGCALIGEETTSTFVWLMRTWLKAVGGQTPKVVITDEGKSLEDAVIEVFPDAQHCFCLWHVVGKVSHNLSHMVNCSENFMMDFSKCINGSWTIEEFEKRWCKMVDKFGLQDDTWFESLYGNRKKWVPAYMRETFLGGINTTEQTESISSFLTKYIHKETKFKEFIEQYKLLLHSMYEEEAKADLEARHRLPALKSVSPFEKQMSTIYTHSIFNKFQEEILGAGDCSVQKECEDETTTTFHVNDREKRQNFTVAWNEAESCIYCLCHSFQYRGFLCRHAMVVLQMLRISNIPSRYILQRWTKGAKMGQTMSELSNRLHHRVQRFNDLSKRAIKLGEVGSLSQETYDLVLNALEEATERCAFVNSSVRSGLDATLALQSFSNIEEDSQGNSSAKKSKKKKVRKKQKIRSEAKVNTSGVQDSSQLMGHLNSAADSLDHSYVPQLVQEMEVGLRTPALNVYYGAQQNMHGAGQLNSLPFTRDGYYRNHQELQALLQGQLGFRASILQGCFNDQDNLPDMEQSGGAALFASKPWHEKHQNR